MSILQVVSGRVTNPGATITALTPNTGDTFAVRHAAEGSVVWLEEVWTQQATLGVTRIRSGRIHDQAQAIRLRNSLAARPLLPQEAKQRLYSGDQLTFEVSGTAAGVDLSAMLIYYEDLEGPRGRLATWEEIEPRIVNLLGAEQAITTSATAGDYGGSQAISADFDQFQRGTDYALLGYLTDVAVGIIGITGPDTGNLRVGGPAPLDPLVTADWFVGLARRSGRPHIPIINADNVGSTLVDAANSTASVAVNVTLILAQLSGARI